MSGNDDLMKIDIIWHMSSTSSLDNHTVYNPTLVPPKPPDTNLFTLWFTQYLYVCLHYPSCSSFTSFLSVTRYHLLSMAFLGWKKLWPGVYISREWSIMKLSDMTSNPLPCHTLPNPLSSCLSAATYTSERDCTVYIIHIYIHVSFTYRSSIFFLAIFIPLTSYHLTPTYLNNMKTESQTTAVL